MASPKLLLASAIILFGAPGVAFPVISLGQYFFADLSEVVNHDGLSGIADPYDSLPTNTTLFSLTENTPYQVSENLGNKLVVADTFGINISIQDLATTFHFIGQIHFGIPNESSNIGKYRFNYADASTLDVILDSNSGSSNWSIDDHCCNWRQRDLPMASLAFQEATPVNAKESLLRELIFENPEPDKFIDSIDFVSSGTGVTPVLAAITYEIIPEPGNAVLFMVAILLLVVMGKAFRKEASQPSK